MGNVVLAMINVTTVIFDSFVHKQLAIFNVNVHLDEIERAF